MNKVLLTGASGFVGKALAGELLRQGYALNMAFRRIPSKVLKGAVAIPVGNIEGDTLWSDALAGVDTVIHSAARVHVMNDHALDPLAEFRKVNVEGTLNLARQAAAAGVKRFVFVSSIKVNGESTTADSPFKPDDVPAPSDPYGISKLEAEIGLRQVCEEAGMEYAIVRPVLVYGPGVKANFLNMMKWLDKGIPLPLGAIKNRRSLVSLTNLMDMLITVASHPAAANQVFLVSDGEDLSTTGLLRRMAAAMGKRANLLPVPESLLKTAALLLGKKSVGQRLCGSLQVDISKNKQLLDWNPPLSVDQGLQRVAEYYLEYR